MDGIDHSKTLNFKGREINRLSNGCLSNPLHWSQEIAERIAEEEGIIMTPRHMDVLVYLRDRFFNFCEDQPNNEQIVNAMKTQWGNNKIKEKDLYALFPRNPCRQAARLAGLQI